MDEYIKKALVGFDGEKFYEATYEKKEYMCMVHDGYAVLFSNNKITENSKAYRDGYRTEVKFGFLTDIYEGQMFATYKENEYKVGRVSSKLKSLELLVRPGHEKEDELLGFVYDLWERTNSKQVTLEEITDIRVEKRSFYEDFIEGKKLEF